MGTQVEKVYVALGNDIQDGIKTLDWTLKRWKSNPLSIVILHITCSISNDFVDTPFGKLPVSAVSDEKLQVLKKYEQEKLDKLLSKYIAFCGKVKAEILKVEKSDEPIHKSIVDLISRYRISKLVMGMTFMKSSSRKSITAISGSFYIHQQKPDFCEFYIVCGGKLVSLKGENEEARTEDDQGLTVARKTNFKSWVGKMFEHSHGSPEKNSPLLATPSDDAASSNPQRLYWENNVEEIDNYFEHLLSLYLDEETCEEELQSGPTQPDVREPDDSTLGSAAKMESIRKRIEEAQSLILLKREEVKANAERCAKAEWAISLCNSRVEELECNIQEEVRNRTEMSKNLNFEREQVQELKSDVQESQNRLSSLIELQSELSAKLQTSTMTRSHVEAQLETAVVSRAEMVSEIEELRGQRDVLRRRIEFCKEKDAIGMVTRMSESSCGYREYNTEDIRLATDDFSGNLRLKPGGDGTNVYRGRINHSTVAIKMLNPDSRLSLEGFLTKVKLLSNMRHPHLVAIMGFCSELRCMVLEYMHNGSLMGILSSTSQRNREKRNRVLRWHDRIRIAHEVCSGLTFLHSAKPWPIVHGNLTTSSVLLDRNMVAKISGFDHIQYDTRHSEEHDPCPDIRAFGYLLLYLLTGRNWAGMEEEGKTTDRTALVRHLHETAGEWPLDLAEELVGVAVDCLSSMPDRGPSPELRLAKVREEVERIRKNADGIVAKGGCAGKGLRLAKVREEVERNRKNADGIVAKGGCAGKGGEGVVPSEVPSVFLCPIFQDIMKNPYIAADGFSYELEAIEEWLKMGRDTSPMTNLRLKHKLLTPNLTLRSLIQDWHERKSAESS